MDTERSKAIRGQLERNLAQRIQALYRTHLEHRLTEVSCQVFDNKVAIILENSVTRPVQMLAAQGKQELAEQVRSNVNQVLEPQLKALVEKVVGVEVIDWLSDAKLESGRTGTIAVLASQPKVGDRTDLKVQSETGSADGYE
jgi:uncharacterized protein YbcI